MLTGDRNERAQSIAREVGIDSNLVRSRLQPDEKLGILQNLRKEYGEIMFVGDGINDAPVLAAADVGQQWEPERMQLLRLQMWCS